MISYANVWPIYHMLRQEADCSSYTFIEGVPSDLNRRLRDGEIDISPSSSIELLRSPDVYDLIENHSISSNGPVGSILLFSRRPLEALSGEVVLMSSQSETSVALLQIIFRKFYGLDCGFRQTAEPIERALKSHAAYLLIGDDALTEALKWPHLHVYDLGDLWTEHTGLPFTYALWLVRKESRADKEELIRQFTGDLDRARDSALVNFRRIAAASPYSSLFPLDGLVKYWEGISYELGIRHKEGFDLFRQYAEELGLIRPLSSP